MVLYIQVYAVEWSDFEKNATHNMLCQIVLGTQFQISCLYVAFSLVAGPQKMLTVTLKCHTQKLKFLKASPETKCVL